MVNIKNEMWSGHEIRFVEKAPGEWWAVLADIADALELTARFIKQRLDDDVVSNHPIPDGMGRLQEMLVVNEYGIYDAIFSSRKPEAKKFKRWVYEILQTLRQSSGLEGFEVFRMMDKEHQKKVMEQLNEGLFTPKQRDFIKANTVTNKCVSTMYGHPKMLKKDQMTPNMLEARQPVLEDTVRLMVVNESLDLGLSISKAINAKYS